MPFYFVIAFVVELVENSEMEYLVFCSGGGVRYPSLFFSAFPTLLLPFLYLPLP